MWPPIKCQMYPTVISRHGITSCILISARNMVASSGMPCSRYTKRGMNETVLSFPSKIYTRKPQIESSPDWNNKFNLSEVGVNQLLRAHMSFLPSYISADPMLTRVRGGPTEETTSEFKLRSAHFSRDHLP